MDADGDGHGGPAGGEFLEGLQVDLVGLSASAQFMSDLDAFAPAREVYEQNTRIAARRVQELITDGVAQGDFRGVHATFAGDLVATMMVRIQQGRVREATGLDDASAYRELASILTAGINA